MANHFSILALRTPWTVQKGKKIGHWKMELPGLVGPQYATEDQWRNNFRKNEETEWSCSVMSDSLWSHSLYPTRLLHPWNFPGKSTGVGCHFLLQGIFLAWGTNPGIPHCRQMLYHLSHQGSPEAKWKQRPAVAVTGDGSQVRSCTEQYCIGTWNVRSMNQGKLEVVKQEMARVNINILRISELKWMWKGKVKTLRLLFLYKYFNLNLTKFSFENQ